MQRRAVTAEGYLAPAPGVALNHSVNAASAEARSSFSEFLDCLLNGSEMRDRTRTLNGVRAMFVPLLVCFLEPAPIFVPERPHEIKVLALLFGRGIKALAPIFGCRIF